MDVWDYFDRRERECERLSVTQDADIEPVYSALEGSNGQRGRIVARLTLSDRAFISVSEFVTVGADGHVHREEYAYYLVVDGYEVEARERDHYHGYHGHGREHVRKAAGPISFKDFVEMAWNLISDLPDLEAATD